MPVRRAKTKADKNQKKGGAKPDKAAAVNAKKIRLPETEEGTVVFNTDPLIVKDHYEIDYIHSYAEDSPFFIGLSQGKLLGSECLKCKHCFATPRAYCLECGSPTKWIDLPLEGRIHTWTTCYYGSQAFLKETPFSLALIEFQDVDTLLLARLVGLSQDGIQIGMKVCAQFLRNSKFKATDVYFVPA
ncbi:MAG: Zn-ribbon domain-containing OB-fold protein [Acidobacteria bacterium]|nr:Zn-ribbon domain-containing OB-fold protein [Acidobacteriota bacterium]